MGSFSCRLWYQCPSQVLTLLTKEDTGVLLDIFKYRCGKQKQGGGDILPFYLIAQHKTGIMVLLAMVSMSFTCVDSFDKTRFRFITRYCPILLCKKKQGGGDVSPFHLKSHHLTRFVVLLSTVFKNC
jgi:hypothetical protein